MTIVRTFFCAGFGAKKQRPQNHPPRGSARMLSARESGFQGEPIDLRKIPGGKPFIVLRSKLNPRRHFMPASRLGCQRMTLNSTRLFYPAY